MPHRPTIHRGDNLPLLREQNAHHGRFHSEFRQARELRQRRRKASSRCERRGPLNDLHQRLGLLIEISPDSDCNACVKGCSVGLAGRKCDIGQSRRDRKRSSKHRSIQFDIHKNEEKRNGSADFKAKWGEEFESDPTADVLLY